MDDVEVYVRYGPSRTLRGERRVPTWLPDTTDTLVVLGLGAQTIEFLLSLLPYDDGFTQGLRELRDMAKDELWSREVL